MKILITASIVALGLSSAPASLLAQSIECGSEPSLRSYNGQPTTLSFRNATSDTVQIHWINYQGGRQPYQKVGPGQSYHVQTYATHPWVIADEAGRCIQAYITQASNSEVAINSSPSAPGHRTPQPENREFTVAFAKINPITQPKGLPDAIRECANNPICNKIADEVGAAYGIPPGSLKGAAAVVGAKRAGEDGRYEVRLPEGYVFCRLKMKLISIAPRGGDRAAALGVTSKAYGVSIYTWVPGNNFFQGKNWIEAELQVLGVRAEAAERYRSMGRCGPLDTTIISCRGDRGGKGQPACASGNY